MRLGAWPVLNVNAGAAIVQAFMETFKDFPPRQKAVSVTIEQARNAMATAGPGE